MLALNRIVSAELLDDRAVYPKEFSIDRQVDLGIWGFGSGEKIKVELIFQEGYGSHLYETPLSNDQVIEELPDKDLRVTATVADTPQLLWWPLGFGEGVEVIAPIALRDHIHATVQEMSKTYAGFNRPDSAGQE